MQQLRSKVMLSFLLLTRVRTLLESATYIHVEVCGGIPIPRPTMLESRSSDLLNMIFKKVDFSLIQDHSTLPHEKVS